MPNKPPIQQVQVQRSQQSSQPAGAPGRPQEGPGTGILRVEGRGVSLQTFAEMYQFAAEIVKSGICPQKDNASTVLAKVEYGLELGIPPMIAINSLYVVNGRITMEADMMLAKVRASGQMKHFHRWTAGEGPGLKAIAETQRVGEDLKAREYSMDDAAKAKLLGKDNWQHHPKDMLLHRATSRILKDVYPDILKGIWSIDQAEDFKQEPIQVEYRETGTEAGSSLDQLNARIQTGQGQTQATVIGPADPAPEAFTDRDREFMDNIRETFANCQSEAELEQAGANLKEIRQQMSEALYQAVAGMYTDRLGEVRKAK